MNDDPTLREFIEEKINHLTEKVESLTNLQATHQQHTDSRLHRIEGFIERRSWRADLVTRLGRAVIAITALIGAVLGIVQALT